MAEYYSLVQTSPHYKRKSRGLANPFAFAVSRVPTHLTCETAKSALNEYLLRYFEGEDNYLDMIIEVIRKVKECGKAIRKFRADPIRIEGIGGRIYVHLNLTQKEWQAEITISSKSKWEIELIKELNVKLYDAIMKLKDE